MLYEVVSCMTSDSSPVVSLIYPVRKGSREGGKDKTLSFPSLDPLRALEKIRERPLETSLAWHIEFHQAYSFNFVFNKAFFNNVEWCCLTEGLSFGLGLQPTSVYAGSAWLKNLYQVNKKSPQVRKSLSNRVAMEHKFSPTCLFSDAWTKKRSFMCCKRVFSKVYLFIYLFIFLSIYLSMRNV